MKERDPAWDLLGGPCDICMNPDMPRAVVWAAGSRRMMCRSCAFELHQGLEALRQGNPFDWPPRGSASTGPELLPVPPRRPPHHPRRR